MSLIETFEHSHLREFAEYESVALPEKTWRTPDHRWWTPQSVLKGWGSRISDHWAWITLHCWIVEKRVMVMHVELPGPLGCHMPDDPTWAFVDRRYGPGETEPLAHPIGRADLACYDDRDKILLMIEFGTCAPAKFILNLGHSCCPVGNSHPLYLVEGTHWMIVPYGCAYAFVFIAAEQLFARKRPAPTTHVVTTPPQQHKARKRTRPQPATDVSQQHEAPKYSPVEQPPSTWPPPRSLYEDK
jgi:hypothetical protein